MLLWGKFYAVSVICLHLFSVSVAATLSPSSTDNQAVIKEDDGGDSDRTAEDARTAAAAIGAWHDYAGLMLDIGQTYYHNSEYDSALICYEEALDVISRHNLNDSRGDSITAELHIKKGVVRQVQGQLHNAIEEYLSALRTAESYRWLDVMEHIYGNLGSVYITLHNYDRAYEYFTKEKDVGVEVNDSLSIAFALVGISSVQLNRNELDEALASAQLAHHIAFTYPEATVESRIFALQSMIEAEVAYKNYTIAFNYANEALQLAEEWDSPLYIAWSLGYIALIQFHLGNYYASEQAALRSLATDSTDLFNNKEVYLYLAKANVMTGNRERAVTYLDKLISANDAYSNSNFQSQLTEMEVKYETAKKDAEIISKNATISQRESERLVLAVVLVFFFIILAMLSVILWMRIRRNRTLSEINATKDKFFNIISHDLRSPAIALRNGLQVMERSAEMLKPDEVKEYSSELLKTSDGQIELLNSILDWARVQAGRLEYNPMIIDLNAELRNELGLARAAASGKGITLTTDIPYGTFVRADRAMLCTVVRNLLNNAVKFTLPGGAVAFTVEKMSNNRYAITIGDNGMGMTAEQLDNIFRIDKRTSINGTAGEQGTGLGLIVCKELVEKHGSTLTVKSEPSKGTSFRFEIEAGALISG